jgi:hypothetical protein
LRCSRRMFDVKTAEAVRIHLLSVDPDAAPPRPSNSGRCRAEALGWTLEQVAEQAQASVGMLTLIETGKRRPSLRSRERIREALEISGAAARSPDGRSPGIGKSDSGGGRVALTKPGA